MVSVAQADAAQAVRALSETEERYRALTEAAQDCIFVIGRDDRIQYVNNYAAAQFGRQPNELIGAFRSTLFAPELSERQGQNLAHVLATGEPYVSEQRLSFATGDVWLHTRLVPIKDANGAVTADTVLALDLGDLRKRYAKKMEHWAVCPLRLADCHEQVVVAVGTWLASRAGAKKIQLLRMKRFCEALNNLGQLRIVLKDLPLNYGVPTNQSVRGVAGKSRWRPRIPATRKIGTVPIFRAVVGASAGSHACK